MSAPDTPAPFIDVVRARWGTQNTTTPEQYHERASAYVWFKCLHCQQETRRRFSAIVDSPDSCSVCSGKIVIPGYNDLASHHPHLAAEWSPRNEHTPDSIIFTGGRRKAWFQCRTCEYEWYVSVAYRAQHGNNCPRCAGQVLIPGVNDMASQHPELIPEWSVNNLVSPHDVFTWSNQQYEWVCAAGHIWTATPAQRWDRATDRPRGCNRCVRSTRRSHGEQELAAVIRSMTTTPVETSYSDLLPGMELDVYLPALHIAFEYNGNYWHSDAVLREKYGQTAHSFHTQRRARAATVGVELYYVWESDWQQRRTDVVQAVRDVIEGGTADALLLHMTREDGV